MVLCVVLARAPRIAGDSSIIYGAGDGAEAGASASPEAAPPDPDAAASPAPSTGDAAPVACVGSGALVVAFESQVYSLWLHNERVRPCTLSTVVVYAERASAPGPGAADAAAEAARLGRLRASLALELLTYTNRSSVRPRTLPSVLGLVAPRPHRVPHVQRGRAPGR